MDITRIQKLAGVISESTTPETQPQVADTKLNTKIGLKEEFNNQLRPAARDIGQADPVKQAQMAPYYKAFHDWKAQCTAKVPSCNFIGTKTGSQALNWKGARPIIVGEWDRATATGKVY